MKKSTKVIFSGSVLIAAATLSAACGSSGDSDYAEICRDNGTNTRTSDDKCEKHTSGFTWVYLPRGTPVPEVGRGVPASGLTSKPGTGTITRGGFGGRVPAGS